ncbi:MAG TPA: hypothetical protein VL172_08635, partial [Kofleriaceae bacterium]|nr:hypothetical protein [Kofleriaceae bacterium]
MSQSWRRYLDLPARPGRTGHLVGLGLAVACGLTWFLACAPYGLWPLAWIGITPLLWLIDRAPTAKRARRYAWVAGIVTMTSGFWWVVPLLSRYSSFPWPLGILALLLYSAYHGLLFYFFALAVRRIRDRSRMRWGRPLPMALVAPLVMAGVETAMPMIFPFQLAVTQAGVLPVIQIADLVGATGVTALLMAVGGALWDMIALRDRRRRLLVAAGTAAALGGTLIYGWVRIGQIDGRRADAPQLAVGLVQGNVAFDGAPVQAEPDYPLRKLVEVQDASAALQRAGAELLVWNESAFPFLLERAAVPGRGALPARHRIVDRDEVEPEP